ncbi:hypothetical protein HDU98_008495 [Podochytrium sp. JEL0797]|nr:hypothetical protein HDU98_008495 [Podochytrium sp. JEL0797]
MPKKIAVTGGNGFIASHTIHELLASPKNYSVTATVRSIAKGGVITGFPGASERLILKEADLLNPLSFDFTGQDVVLHIASPFALTVKDNQKDLVDPAVKGTLAVLEAAKKAGTVKTVVLTSSLASVTEKPQAGTAIDEAMWNEDSSLNHNPYYFSKVMAEKAAWKFMEDNPECGFKLIAILPSFVIGPAYTINVNESVSIIANIVQGGFPFRFNLWWPFVDVRDVAHTHILAFEKADLESGRYLAVGDRSVSMGETCDMIKAQYPELRKVPRWAAPNIVPRLASYLQPVGTGTFLRVNLSKEKGYDISNKKVKEALGVQFRPVEESVKDTVEDLIKWKHI